MGLLMSPFLQVAMKALGFDENKQEVLRILRKYGALAAPNSTRMFITYEAFAQVMAEKISARDPLEEILRAFSLFAGTAVQTNNGEELRIGVEDLRRVARELGENLEEEEIQAMIREFDLDNDNLSKMPSAPPLHPWLSCSAVRAIFTDNLHAIIVSKDEFIAICRGE